MRCCWPGCASGEDGTNRVSWRRRRTGWRPRGNGWFVSLRRRMVDSHIDDGCLLHVVGLIGSSRIRIRTLFVATWRVRTRIWLRVKIRRWIRIRVGVGSRTRCAPFVCFFFGSACRWKPRRLHVRNQEHRRQSQPRSYRSGNPPLSSQGRTRDWIRQAHVWLATVEKRRRSGILGLKTNGTWPTSRCAR